MRVRVKRTAKGLYRAKFCCVPFAVRLGKKRTAKLCRAFSSLCRAPELVFPVVSSILFFQFVQDSGASLNRALKVLN
jgi:hypothetical protein